MLNHETLQDTAIVPLEPARRLAVRSPEAAQMLGISRSTLYQLMGDGEVESIKLGRTRLILVASLESLIERKRRWLEQLDGSGQTNVRGW
ncbi:helix-turn-helix domain-containing protein [Sphingomonas sp. LaA6.9]|uniref:helix-turn-helix domain-containing protein n=1 Tax=Sphingomonas sp. LaA6.9 TaxID=2919914 RepID=UPI001F4F7C2A|nr:helix-turn-helix domain-containing protein [Sphingomonas sp. LaA6.9]MCJ8158893.1 helix-turn-helix domain-containing protein [Sphingomonas sp. LaA6.9]